MIRLLVLALLALQCIAVRAAEPVAATYRLTVRNGGEHHHAQFLLLRSDDVVEVHDPHTGVVERWELEPGGRLFYLRIFPDAGRVIEFQPADFRAAGVTSDWDVARTVTGTAVLGQLEHRGSRRLAGHRAEMYRGSVNGTPTEIGWIAELALPARVDRRVDAERQELRLIGLERGAPAATRFFTREQLHAFESIDFADLGDRHGDPFVDRVLRQGGLQLHEH